MASPTSDEAPPPGVAHTPWRAELRETLRLSAPMALIQLGQIGMMTSDLLFIGRLGDGPLAAAALAHSVLFVAFTVGAGLVAAVAPLVAQAYGARKPRLVRRSLRVGLWAAIMLGAPLTLLQVWGADILIALGQDRGAAALAGRYLTGLTWALVPAWGFIALRNFMGALDRPQPALWITLAAIPINALAAYALIFGRWGLPRLELLGAGLATTADDVGLCAAALAIATTRRPFKKFRVLAGFWRADWTLLAKLVALGVPIGAALLLEYGVFAAAALLMGRISQTAVAAHQIALQTAAVLYMVPFGISLAASVRVGQAVGRRDASATRRAGFVAIGIGALFMSAMTLIVGLGRDAIPPLFLGAAARAAGDTVALASTLLLPAMSFFVADGVQVVAAGALRGLNDTRMPLFFAAVSFWCVGFVSALLLAFPLGLGAVGVWIGLALATVVHAGLLLGRFQRLTRRRYLPPLPETPAGSRRARTC